MLYSRSVRPTRLHKCFLSLFASDGSGSDAEMNVRQHTGRASNDPRVVHAGTVTYDDDDDADFKKRSQQTVVQLQSGDKYALNAWQLICDVSRKAFEEIYSRLGVSVYERGESYYNPMIKPLVDDLMARGLVVESKGAKCIFCPRVCEVPLMVVKGDGGCYNL